MSREGWQGWRNRKRALGFLYVPREERELGYLGMWMFGLLGRRRSKNANLERQSGSERVTWESERHSLGSSETVFLWTVSGSHFVSNFLKKGGHWSHSHHALHLISPCGGLWVYRKDRWDERPSACAKYLYWSLWDQAPSCHCHYFNYQIIGFYFFHFFQSHFIIGGTFLFFQKVKIRLFFVIMLVFKGANSSTSSGLPVQLYL